MEKSGVQKSLSLTIRSSGILQSGVFLGYCGLKLERRFKVVLLSGTMGVLGSLAAYAGPTGLPFGAEFEKMGPAGPVASQTTDECLPSDIACLLLRPVGAVPGGPTAGAGERGQDDGSGGGGGGPPGGGPPGDDPPGDDPPGDDPPGDDPPGDDPPGDGDNGFGNGDSGTNTGQDGLAEGDTSNPGLGGGFGRNGGGNAGGGSGSDHE